MSEVRYLWLDLETTGLDPATDHILEVGWVVTDQKLVELTEPRSLLVDSDVRFETLDQTVREMHKASGLWGDLIVGPRYSLSGVRLQLGSVLDIGPHYQLAGSGVHFDKAFLAHHLPGIRRQLHYRVLDVSTLERFLRDVCGLEVEKPETPHRALPDALHALELTRRFRDQIGTLMTGGLL